MFKNIAPYKISKIFGVVESSWRRSIILLFITTFERELVRICADGRGFRLIFVFNIFLYKNFALGLPGFYNSTVNRVAL